MLAERGQEARRRTIDELLGDQLNGYFGGYDDETIRRRSFCCVCGKPRAGGWLSLAVTEADAQGLWMTHAVIMKKMREEDSLQSRLGHGGRLLRHWQDREVLCKRQGRGSGITGRAATNWQLPRTGHTAMVLASIPVCASSRS